MVPVQTELGWHVLVGTTLGPAHFGMTRTGDALLSLVEGVELTVMLRCAHGVDDVTDQP